MNSFTIGFRCSLTIETCLTCSLTTQSCDVSVPSPIHMFVEFQHLTTTKYIAFGFLQKKEFCHIE